ncbi:MULTISPECIES: hypothetical protein [unclassified Ruegeria]|uniref:hypothetical protein n=1 Tax=unclassified Ruegeria TaxID=2625375 RepID=UPI001488D521|nr:MULTISPECIES: hypothetical protein [unclassified Ruegeria]
MSGTISAPVVSSNAVRAAVPAGKDAVSTATVFRWAAPIAGVGAHVARSSGVLQAADAHHEG